MKVLVLRCSIRVGIGLSPSTHRAVIPIKTDDVPRLQLDTPAANLSDSSPMQPREFDSPTQTKLNSSLAILMVLLAIADALNLNCLVKAGEVVKWILELLLAIGSSGLPFNDRR